MTDEDLAEARQAQRIGDHATAVAIYRRWAEQGDARAQDQLGMLYESGPASPRAMSRRQSGIDAPPTRATPTPRTTLA